MGTIERKIRFNTTEERTEYIRQLLGGKDVLYLSHDGTTYYAAVSCGLENKAYVVITYQRQHPHNPSDYGFGYEIQSECVGPHHWNAPLAILKLLTQTKNPLALEWRAKVERTRRNEKKLRSMPIGTRVRIKGHAAEEFVCVRKKEGGRIWMNGRRTHYIPFRRLIQYDVEVLGVDQHFTQRTY